MISRVGDPRRFPVHKLLLQSLSMTCPCPCTEIFIFRLIISVSANSPAIMFSDIRLVFRRAVNMKLRLSSARGPALASPKSNVGFVPNTAIH